MPNLTTTPNSEYFTIVLHHTIGDVHKWIDCKLAEYTDYCCPDRMSRLELVNIAKELNLDVEGYKFWWLDIFGDVMGMKEIETDADALTMAQHIDFCKEINNFARVTRLIEPSSRIGGGGIAADERVIKDRVDIDLDRGDELGEKMQDHTLDTNGGLNGGDGNAEDDTYNGLIERCGGLDGGIVEEERGTRSNSVEKDGGLHSGDTTREELETKSRIKEK